MYIEKRKNELVKIFVNNILTTNRGYNFFVNWDNILSVKDFEIELHAMDSIIRADNFKETFFELLKKYLPL